MRYTTGDGPEIAYSTIGAGPIDLLLIPQQFRTFELFLDGPLFDRWSEPVGRFARQILYDRRGLGLSERGPGAVPLEDQTADVTAVLDATGSTQAALFGYGDAAMMAILFAASHPQRVSHLILFHGQARLTASAGYEWALTEEQRCVQMIEPTLADWPGGGFTARRAAPIWSAQDPSATAIVGRWQRLSGPPREARRHLELSGKYDVREILPQVQAPTLVLDRPEAGLFDRRHAQYLAARIPGAEHLELPGGDTLFFADGVKETIAAVESFVAGRERRPSADRVLATVMFTDMVESTTTAAELGDSGWRSVLSQHDALSRELVKTFGGRPVKSTGDGILAVFDGPGRAVRCAVLLIEKIRDLGLELRAGIHTGEVELIGDDVAGIAVHIGARIAAVAEPSEVIASSTVRDLVVGSDIEFHDRGEHELKGIAGGWRLCRVGRIPPDPATGNR